MVVGRERRTGREFLIPIDKRGDGAFQLRYGGELLLHLLRSGRECVGYLSKSVGNGLDNATVDILTSGETEHKPLPCGREYFGVAYGGVEFGFGHTTEHAVGIGYFFAQLSDVLSPGKKSVEGRDGAFVSKLESGIEVHATLAQINET